MVIIHLLIVHSKQYTIQVPQEDIVKFDSESAFKHEDLQSDSPNVDNAVTNTVICASTISAFVVIVLVIIICLQCCKTNNLKRKLRNQTDINSGLFANQDDIQTTDSVGDNSIDLLEAEAHSVNQTQQNNQAPRMCTRSMNRSHIPV
jgi:hypothetical protein